MNKCTEESFLKDVTTHEMEILLDNDVYRHVRFKRPNTGNMYFDLITGPGYLLYRGDMGCYEFERINDMFDFFRSSEEELQRWNVKIAINKSYWGEKLQAISIFGNGYTEYDEELFIEAINERVNSFLEDYPHTDTNELKGEVADEVLSKGEFECEAVHAAMDFKFKGKEIFSDFWETRLTRPTYHYTWACYAIAWGIQQYDKAKGIQA